MTRHAMQSLIRLTHPSEGQAPFKQLLPCPWCQVTEDRGHDVKKHTDEELGERR